MTSKKKYSNSSIAWRLLLALLCSISVSLIARFTLSPDMRLKSSGQKIQARINYFQSQNVLGDSNVPSTTAMQQASARSNDLLFEIIQNNKVCFATSTKFLPNVNDTNTTYSRTLHHHFLIKQQPCRWQGNAAVLKSALVLKREYPTDASLLQSRFTADPTIPANWQLSAVEKKQSAYPLRLNNGSTVLYLSKEDADIVSSPIIGLEVLCLLLLFAGITFCYTACIHIHYKFGRLISIAVFVLCFFLFRLLNYFIDWPIVHSNFQVFSVSYFALDTFSRSLGDVLLNSAWFCGLICLLYFRGFSRDKLRSNTAIQHIELVAYLLLAALVFIYNIFIIDNLILRSKLNFDAGFFTATDLPHYIGILIVAGAIIMQALLAFWYGKRIMTLTKLSANIVLIYHVLVFILGSAIILSSSAVYKLSYCSLLLLVVAFLFICARRFFTLKSSIFTVAMLLGIAMASAVFAVYASLRKSEQAGAQLKQYASQIIHERDVSVEREILDALETYKGSFADSTGNTDDALQLFITNDVRILADLKLKPSIINRQSNKLFIDSICSKAEISPFDSALFYVPAGLQGIRYLYIPKNSFNCLALNDNKLSFLQAQRKTLLQTNSITDRTIRNSFDVALYSNGKLIQATGGISFANTIIPTKSGDTTFRINGKTFWEFTRYNDKVQQTDTVLFAAQPYLYRVFVSVFSFMFIALLGLAILLFSLYYIIASKFSYKRLILLLKPNLELRFSVAIFIAEAIGFAFIMYLSSKAFVAKNQTSKEEVRYQNLQNLKQLNVHECSNPVQLDSVAQMMGIDFQIYDNNGNLRYTSNPEPYNRKLLRSHLHPSLLNSQQLSTYAYHVQNELIDELEYQSSYLTVGSGANLATLQIVDYNYFYDTDLSTANFFAVGLSIFIAVFILTLSLAYLIIKYLLSKLVILSDDMRNFSLNINEEAHVLRWPYNDEIGVLVAQYNKMMDNVQKSAGIIVAQQKDLAWREMAKQVAHEIKNPITPIKLNLQRLLISIDNNDPNLVEKTKKACLGILQQIDQLSKIAGTFSEYANLPELNANEFDMVQLCKELVDLNQDGTPNIDITFHTTVDELLVMQDKLQIQRVINNLLSNAIQSIPNEQHGKIDVHLSTKQHPQQMVSISVKDTGCGIPIDKFDMIFKPYFTTKTSGTGLGLAMCRELCNRMGGTLEFTSKVNVGSTFTLELPVRMP